MWGSLEIDRKEPDESGGVHYQLSGALTYGDPGSRFVDSVKQDLEGGIQAITLDLQKLERIDSGGIGLLAMVMASGHNADASIRVTGLPDRYRKMFKVVGLAGVFGLDEDSPE